MYLNVADRLNTYVFSVVNCCFDGNTAASGSTDVMIGSSSQTAPVSVEIRDCVFSNSNGVDSSSSVNIQGISLQSGEIANCTFTSTHDITMSLILLGPGAGTFSIHDLTIDSINASAEDLIYLFQYSTLSVNISIADMKIANSEFHSGIRVASGYLNISSSIFESNTGIALYNEGGAIEVHQSSFYDSSSDSSPCYYQGAYANSAFYETSFMRNSASQVGTIEIVGPSTSATFEDCLFINNSATGLSGVMHLMNSPDVSIDNCRFVNNSANAISVILFERTASNVFVRNSVFESNLGSGLLKVVSSTVVMQNVTFINLDFTAKDYQIMLVSNSNLTLQNSVVTLLDNLRGLGGCFLSMLMGSTATISSTTISGVQCQPSVITVMLSSSLSLLGSTFHNVTSSMGSVISSSSKSTLILQSAGFHNISVYQGVIFTQQTDVTIVDSSFDTVNRGIVLHTESCSSVIIQSTSFDFVTAQTNIGAVQSVGCNQVFIQNSTFTNISAAVTAGLQVYNGNVSVINCTFQQLTAQTHGAIEIEGSSVTILQSRFMDNSAGSTSNSLGGAVYMNTLPNTSIVIDRNSFARNSAIAGGAVYWNSLQSMSNLEGNNWYEENTALYGNDTAYSAFKLRYGNESIPLLASGQSYTGSVLIEIVDQLGQVIATDSSSKALMVLVTGYSLTGSLVATATKGIFSLSEFIVTGTPGTNVTVTIVPNTPNCLNVSLTFLLRDCVIGEIRALNGACVRCGDGTYSLSLYGTSCGNCLPQATCRNGSDVYPNPGYWRPNELYAGLFQCPNSGACENLPHITSVTGTCAEGYTGNMCQSCAEGYSRSGADKCAGCPTQAKNIIRLSFVGLALFIFVGILVRSALKSATSKENYNGAFMKIFMNYLHMTILIANFGLSWPSVLQGMFTIHAYLGSSGEQLMSLDCTLSQAYFKKVAIIAVLPVALLLVNLVLWALFHVIFYVRHLSAKLICSLIVILVYVHPIIVKNTLSAFHCITIMPGELWLRDEMGISCWDHTYSTYALNAALPALILWGFGIPTAALALLIKKRKRLSELYVKLQMGFLYTGFQGKTFFWELVIMYRKVCIILLYVFMSSQPVLLQALALCLLLYVAEKIQSRFEPFQTSELNRLEQRSIWVSIITIYSGIFFSMNALSYAVEIAFTTLILIANAYFLLLWGFLFSHAFLTQLVKNYPRIGRFLPFLRLKESGPLPARSPTLSSLMKRLYIIKLDSQVELLAEQLD